MELKRELTVRALAAGLVVGALLAAANLYLGLAVGLWDSGSITAVEFDALKESVSGRPVRFPDLSLVRTENESCVGKTSMKVLTTGSCLKSLQTME